ncbi:MAG: GrpB family protein [Aeromicrobium sp.]
MTIGELAVLGGQVTLADYDPAWPAMFEGEAARLRSVLSDQVRRLEHVGSTSVPGLAAKPIIDIVLAVPDSSDEAAYVPPMEAAGYVLRIREPEWFEHRLFKGPDISVNVHVFTDGEPEVRRMVAFRDWLRHHDNERLLYERTKRELAARDWKYVQHYADAKTEVVAAIMGRALAADSTSPERSAVSTDR